MMWRRISKGKRGIQGRLKHKVNEYASAIQSNRDYDESGGQRWRTVRPQVYVWTTPSRWSSHDARKYPRSSRYEAI